MVKFDRVTPEGAEVDVAADGAFTYTPKNGFGGNDTFTYTLADGSKATVFISVPRTVWFINNDPQVAAGSANRGTLGDPFASISAYNASSLPRPGDVVFLHSGTYTGSFHLLDGQVVASKVDAFLAESPRRWGDYDALNLPASLVFPQEPATIQTPSGDAVTLAKDNALIGITIRLSGGYAVKGQDFGRLSMYGVSITGPGAGVDLKDGSLDAQHTDISSSDSTRPALRWQFGLAASDANDAPPHKPGKCGPGLTLAYCHILGPNGGLDARVFGSASATITVTDSVIAGGEGVGAAVRAQGTSTLSATFTGNDIKGKQYDFALAQQDASTFTLPGFPGGDANAVRTFIQDNNVGTPSVFITGNIRF